MISGKLHNGSSINVYTPLQKEFMRPTGHITDKSKSTKTTYMSSGRLNEKDEPIINTSNIQKEIKAYKSLKLKT